MYISPCIIYHCQLSPTEGAKAISTLWRRVIFFKKRIPPLPSNQRRIPISLCCHIIFPECLLETARCTVIPGNSESLVLVSNSHQISQVVETLNIIEWRITCFAWVPKSVKKLKTLITEYIARTQYCCLHLKYYADLKVMENNSKIVFCVHILMLTFKPRVALYI